MNIELVIKEVVKKVSKTNQDFLKVSTDKGSFFCFNAQCFPQIVPGKKLLVVADTESQFKSILGVDKELDQTSVQTPLITPANAFKTDYNERQGIITNQWAINAALKVLELNREEFKGIITMVHIKDIALQLKEIAINLKGENGKEEI